MSVHSLEEEVIGVFTKVHGANQVYAFGKVPFGWQHSQRWVHQSSEHYLWLDYFISNYFLFNGEFFKVFIDVSSGNFSSYFAYQLSDIFFCVQAFVFRIVLQLVYFLLNFFFSRYYLRQAAHKFLHFSLLFRTRGYRHMNYPNWSYWGVMADFLNAFDCLMVFVLMSWRLLNIIGKFIMIWDTHVFLAFLAAFATAAFSLDVFEGFSRNKKESYLWSLLNYLC